MARLRYNGLRATLGAHLSSSATSVSFAAALQHSGGTAVPTLSGGDYIPLAIIDHVSGDLDEIVHLTAYTTGTDTGTISRGQESTTGVSHNVGDFAVNAPMLADVADATPDADTTTKGKVELATDAETIARTDATRAVTPHGLDAALDAVEATIPAATPDATDTVKGKVELATDAETATGTDATRAVTPHGLSAAISAIGQLEATTDDAGVVELATRTETAARTDTTRAVTPDGLDAALDAVEATIPAATPDATDTVKGKVELATDAETATGTDATRAVTPHGLGSLGLVNTPDADTSTKGKVELATRTETAARSDATRAVTPDGLDAALDAVEATIPAATPDATDTVKGKVELATDAETVARSDAVRAVTPHGLDAALDAFSSGVDAELANKADLVAGQVPLDQLGGGVPGSGTYVDGASGNWAPIPGAGGFGIPYMFAGVDDGIPDAGELMQTSDGSTINLHLSDVNGNDSAGLFTAVEVLDDPTITFVIHQGDLYVICMSSGSGLSDSSHFFFNLDSSVDMLGFTEDAPCYLVLR